MGSEAARSGEDQVRPSLETPQVNQARLAWESKVVSYQQAHSVPVVGSTADAGANCCVFPLSGGSTRARKSGVRSGRSATAYTSDVWFAPPSA